MKKKKNLKKDLCGGNKSAKCVISALLLVIITTFVMSNNSALAQQCPDPPDCYGQPFMYGGQLTIEHPVGSGCQVTFEYCYRLACGVYNDMYINILYTSGNCNNQSGPFDPAYYKDLVTGCASVVVALNPWITPTIPPCPQSSQIYWRLGHPSCVSDWYNAIIQSPSGGDVGVIVKKIAPCNAVTLPAICWNTITYCWEQISPDIQMLTIVSNNSGAPSQYACPPIYRPTDAMKPGTQINCNSLCE